MDILYLFSQLNLHFSKLDNDDDDLSLVEITRMSPRLTLNNVTIRSGKKKVDKNEVNVVTPNKGQDDVTKESRRRSLSICLNEAIYDISDNMSLVTNNESLTFCKSQHISVATVHNVPPSIAVIKTCNNT